METRVISGVYGSQHTPCEVLVCEDWQGTNWYVVEGSVNVNATYDDIQEGVDVEVLQDVDMFTWSSPITNEQELIEAIES